MEGKRIIYIYFEIIEWKDYLKYAYDSIASVHRFYLKLKVKDDNYKKQNRFNILQIQWLIE